MLKSVAKEWPEVHVRAIDVDPEERADKIADQLIDELLSSDDGLVVQVRAGNETLSTVRSDDPLLLARACYHLGNRHMTIQILPGMLRYPHDHVLDDMLRGLGLEVTIEQAPFEPEPGAYGGSADSHGQHHQHEHSHHHH